MVDESSSTNESWIILSGSCSLYKKGQKALQNFNAWVEVAQKDFKVHPHFSEYCSRMRAVVSTMTDDANIYMGEISDDEIAGLECLLGDYDRGLFTVVVSSASVQYYPIVKAARRIIWSNSSIRNNLLNYLMSILWYRLTVLEKAIDFKNLKKKQVSAEFAELGRLSNNKKLKSNYDVEDNKVLMELNKIQNPESNVNHIPKRSQIMNMKRHLKLENALISTQEKEENSKPSERKNQLTNLKLETIDMMRTLSAMKKDGNRRGGSSKGGGSSSKRQEEREESDRRRKLRIAQGRGGEGDLTEIEKYNRLRQTIDKLKKRREFQARWQQQLENERKVHELVATPEENVQKFTPRTQMFILHMKKNQQSPQADRTEKKVRVNTAGSKSMENIKKRLTSALVNSESSVGFGSQVSIKGLGHSKKPQKVYLLNGVRLQSSKHTSGGGAHHKKLGSGLLQIEPIVAVAKPRPGTGISQTRSLVKLNNTNTLSTFQSYD